MDDAPATGALAAASVENAIALGRRRGQPVARVGEARDLEDAADVSAERCHAQWDGFDLDASHAVPAGARARLERLCRLWELRITGSMRKIVMERRRTAKVGLDASRIPVATRWSYGHAAADCGIRLTVEGPGGRRP